MLWQLCCTCLLTLAIFINIATIPLNFYAWQLKEIAQISIFIEAVVIVPFCLVILLPLFIFICMVLVSQLFPQVVSWTYVASTQ